MYKYLHINKHVFLQYFPQEQVSASVAQEYFTVSIEYTNFF